MQVLQYIYSTVVGSGWFQCIVVYIFAIVWYYLGCVPVYNSRSHFYHNLCGEVGCSFSRGIRESGIFWMVGNSGISSEKFASLGRTVAFNTVKPHDTKPCGSSGSARRSMVWAWPREMPIPTPRWPAPCGFANANERGQRGRVAVKFVKVKCQGEGNHSQDGLGKQNMCWNAGFCWLFSELVYRWSLVIWQDLRLCEARLDVVYAHLCWRCLQIAEDETDQILNEGHAVTTTCKDCWNVYIMFVIFNWCLPWDSGTITRATS